MKTPSPTYRIRQNTAKLIRTGLIVGYHPQLTKDPRPAGIKSTMPEHVRDFFESYGLNNAIKGRPPLTNADISIHDRVVAAMASRHLAEYRDLLWSVAARVPWKRILPEMKMPERSAKRRYAQGLMIFAQVYGLGAVAEMREAA